MVYRTRTLGETFHPAPKPAGGKKGRGGVTLADTVPAPREDAAPGLTREEREELEGLMGINPARRTEEEQDRLDRLMNLARVTHARRHAQRVAGAEGAAPARPAAPPARPAAPPSQHDRDERARALSQEMVSIGAQLVTATPARAQALTARLVAIDEELNRP